MKPISKLVGYVMGVGLLLVVLGAVPVAAAPCDVPSSAYPTIQAAVDDAMCVIINVAAGTYTEHVMIDHHVRILGAGQESTIVDSGAHLRRVVEIGGGMPGSTIVAIDGVTIQNGNGFGSGGGGILNFGTLTLQNSTVTSNSGRQGGGILNFGTLTLQNSTVTGNSGSDGGILNEGGGTLIVLDSTIADNCADFGGGIYNDGRLTVVNSTLAGNSTSSACGGGGGGGGGGGIAHFSDRLTIANSLITGNNASDGGGIFIYGGTVTLAHVTFENNTPNDCTGCP